MFENFPYTDMHQLNLDWIIKIAKDFLDQYTTIQNTINTGLENLDNTINTGLENLNGTINTGLESLNDKATELEGLLQAWYNTHSEDIADQLRDALTDIQNELTRNINLFNQQVELKTQDVIESIPADYTNLATAFQTYVMDPSKNNQEELLYNTIVDKLILTADGTIQTASNTKFCITSPIEVVEGERLVLNLTALYGNACIAFYTSDDTFVSAISNNQGESIGTNRWRFTNYIVNVPATAKIARIGWNSDYTHSFTKYPVLIEKLANVILPNTVDELVQPSYSVVSGVFIQDGVKYTDAGSSWKMTSPISVESGDRFVYTGYMNYNNYIVAFYRNGTLVDGITANVGETVATNIYYNEDFEFVVPSNVDAMEIGYWINGNYRAFSINKHIISLVTESFKPWYGMQWICMGDSITNNENTTATMRYYDYISEKTLIQPYIMAVDGSGYKRGEGAGNAFYQIVTSCPTTAKVITIFGSFNDLGSTYTLGTKTDTGTDTIAGCINTTLDNLFTRMPLANVGIVSPCPWSNRWPGAQYADTTNAYVQLLKDICEYRSIPFLDMYHESGLRPWDEAFRQAAYTRDNGGGTHPDETGHKILASKFEAFLDMLLLR